MKTILKAGLMLAVLGGGYWGMTRDRAAGPAYSTNAAEDIKKAAAAARAARKRVLVDVGSDGCVWCVRMHKFIESDPELRALAAASFVTVRADLRANAALLNGYAPVPGTPHFFVLGEAGQLLCSQDTESMESGRSYDRAKVLAFFRSWAL